MDKYSKFVETLRKGLAVEGRQGLLTGVVKSVEGNTCTVTIDGNDIPDVRLKLAKTDESNYLLLTPATGSVVLLGCLGKDLNDMIVLVSERYEQMTWQEGSFKVTVDKTAGKMNVLNGQTSIEDVFESLQNLINNLKVIVPVNGSPTPSTSLDPVTITNLNVFAMKFKSLFNLN